MNPRPYYALILLAIVLLAALQLTGSSQPRDARKKSVALAPRPAPIIVAKVKKPLPLDYLLERNDQPVEIAKQAPFVDHYAVMKSVFSMSSAGLGNSTMIAKSAGPASENYGVVVQHELEPSTQVADVARPTMGFEEFTAIVHYPFDFEAESNAEIENLLAWQSGCGVDHNTGDVYPLPGSMESFELAQTVGPSAGTVIWQGILRVYSEELQNLLHRRVSLVPSLKELLEFTMRRVAID